MRYSIVGVTTLVASVLCLVAIGSQSRVSAEMQAGFQRQSNAAFQNDADRQRRIDKARENAAYRKQNDGWLPITREGNHPLIIEEQVAPTGIYTYPEHQHFELADEEYIDKFIEGVNSGSEGYKEVKSLGLDLSFENAGRRSRGTGSETLKKLAESEALQNALLAINVLDYIHESDLEAVSKFKNLRQFKLKVSCNDIVARKFVLGFKDLQVLDGNFVGQGRSAGLEAVSHLPSLKVVDLREVRSGDVKDLKRVLELPSLEYLYLGEWAARQFHQSSLRLPKSLKGLHCKCTPPLLDAVVKMEKLDWLVLSGGSVTMEQFSEALSNFAELRAHFNAIEVLGELAGKEFKGTPVFPFASIAIRSCKFRDCETFTISSFPKAKAMSFFDTRNLGDFFDLKGKREEVEYLCLPCSKDNTPADMRTLSKFPNLKALKIWGDAIEKDFVKRVVRLKSLEILDLQNGCSLSDVAPLGKLTELRVLRLRGGRDPLSGVLKLLSKSTTLEVLDVQSRVIEEKELEKVRELIKSFEAEGRKFKLIEKLPNRR